MDDAYVLHNRLGSGGFVVEAAFALAGVDLVYEPLQSAPSTPLGDAVAAMNPWGQVPILTTPDGRVLTEVAAIIIYLDRDVAAFRESPLLAHNDPAAFIRWSVFASVNIYENVLRRCYPDRYAAPPLDLSDDAPEAMRTFQTGIEAVVGRSLVAAATSRAHRAFAVLDREIGEKPGDFILGETLSMCDLLVAMLYAWQRRKRDLPNCSRLTELVASHRVVNPIWERNFGRRLDEKWHENRTLWG